MMFKTFRESPLFSAMCLLAVSSFIASSVNAQRRQTASTPAASQREADPLKALQWRQVGPFRGGGATAVVGGASQPTVFYFGRTGGGVWKTRSRVMNRDPVRESAVVGSTT